MGVAVRLWACTTVSTAALGAASPAAGQLPVVRDSAGIRIIENPAPDPAARPPFLVADSPALQLGAEDRGPELMFNDIATATLLANGSIAVADRSSGELRIFDASGRFLRKLGSRGEGPGEFRRLSHVQARAGDTLLAWDAIGGRFTIFDPAGRVSRIFTAQADPVRSPATFGLVRDVLSDGRFFGYRRGRHLPPAVEAVTRDTLLVALYSPDATFVRAVGRFLALETIQHAGGTMRNTSGVIVQAFSVKGVPFPREAFLVAGTEWLYAGDGGLAYEILGYDRGGILERIIRVRQDPRLVSAEVIARYRAQPRGRPDRTFTRPPQNPNIDARWFPKTLPAYAGFLLDAAQRLWVKAYPLPGDRQPRWNVFDADGSLLGSVPTPPGVEVLEIGTNYLLGVWRDELDVEYVRLYALSPAR